MRIISLLLVAFTLAFCAREETLWPIIEQSRNLLPDSISEVAMVNVNDSTDTLRFSYGAYIHNVVPIGDDGEAVESTSQISNILHPSGNETFNITLRSRGGSLGDRLTLTDMNGSVRWGIDISDGEIRPGENTAVLERYVIENDTIPNAILGLRESENISTFIYVQEQGRRFIAVKKSGAYYVQP